MLAHRTDMGNVNGKLLVLYWIFPVTGMVLLRVEIYPPPLKVLIHNVDMKFKRNRHNSA